MKLYHQTGHNHIWNLQSFNEDNAGNGLIFSPVNIESKKLQSDIDQKIKEKSFFDPQLYLINEKKGELPTYSFYPTNIRVGFKTEDLNESSYEIAKNCIDYQIANDFEYIIIPARYFDAWPTKYYDDFLEAIIVPFINYYKSQGLKKKLLLTIIVKQIQVTDAEARNQLLNWITSIQKVSGVYLIFETNFTTKQIKDAGYLYNALLFIHYLKMNGFEVHIGYNNTEGLLFSIANPNSISMGAYENLRNFSVRRFVSKKIRLSSPNPRLYFAKLYQWIDCGYLDPIKTLYKDHENLLEDSKYKPLMFKKSFKWHFQKPELYKHFFLLFSNQVLNLPNLVDGRINFLNNSFSSALKTFKEIKESGIALDENSDGSHLNHWITATNMFKKYKEENRCEF